MNAKAQRKPRSGSIQEVPGDSPRVLGETIYNTVRLHSAIGYLTPHTKLAGNEKVLFSQSSLPSEMRSSKRLGKDEGFGELRQYKTLRECPESIRLSFT